jgi:hypothetical protein
MKIDPIKVFALLQEKARGDCPDAGKAREFLKWMHSMSTRAEKPLEGWAKDESVSRIQPEEPDRVRATKLKKLAGKTFKDRYLSQLAEDGPLVAEIRITKKKGEEVEGAAGRTDRAERLPGFPVSLRKMCAGGCRGPCVSPFSGTWLGRNCPLKPSAPNSHGRFRCGLCASY